MGGCFTKPPNAAKNVSAASQIGTPKADTPAAAGQVPPGAGKKVFTLRAWSDCLSC